MLKPALHQEALMYIADYLASNTAIIADYSDVRKRRFK